MKYKDYDFSGWATRSGIKCSDGRTILKDAFKDCDGQSVPIVWNHQHDSAENVLGHALLENKDEGVYVYGYFNDTDMGNVAKEQVMHRDITNLSIYANKLKQSSDGCVSHGIIREVSLVLAGANPGAVIDCVLAHSDDSEEEAIIYTDESIDLSHADKEVEETKKGEDMANEEKKPEEVKEEKKSEKTGKEVFDTLNEEQKTLVYALVGAALEEKAGAETKEESKDEGEKEMKHNVFESEAKDAMYASAKKEFEEAVIRDAKSFGSMRDSYLAHKEEFKDYLAHSIDTTGMDTDGEINREDADGAYGIGNMDFLFPEARAFQNEPEMIKRKDEWVMKVMNGVHKSPFARVKSLFADITEDEARAKGYITGNKKKNEVFTLLKRSTDPQTVYKKQKLDRDDVLDITDFNVVAYVKNEMRYMLNEELAGAFLFGDGRDSASDDKIQEAHIRPVAFDAPLFTIPVITDIDHDDLGVDDVASETAAKVFVRSVLRGRKAYRGAGNPTMFIGEDLLTEILLLEDGFGHAKYDNVAALATALRMKEIVSCPLLDERVMKDANDHRLLAVIVDLNAYNVGANRGGEVNLFDDFDIDYNQYKYLLETRCSGAMTKPFSAMAVFGAEVASEDPDPGT